MAEGRPDRTSDRPGDRGPGPAAGETPARVAVLASGGGTNLQALLDRFGRDADPPARVALVVGSSPGIGALDRARNAGVETAVLEEGREDGELLLGRLDAADADLVVLAGWLRRVPAPVVRAYRGRMVNIHPALLPSFGGKGMYGRRVHEAVLRSGARVSGPTVHFVDEAYDEGAIIAQWPVPVKEDDDPDRLAARVLEREHRVLPEVVAALARGEVWLDEEGRARWERPWFPGERFTLEEE